MLIVLSPAKSLDYTSALPDITPTEPLFSAESAKLIKRLRPMAPAEIGTLMKISDKLAQLNVERYANWSPRATIDNARAAIFAFNGDVYEGLDAASMTLAQIAFLQKHLRILSGLYGVLRPLDLMQPYRLEMSTRLDNARGKDLYAFWGDRISDYLAEELTAGGKPVLVNLASEEYFKSVRPQKLNAPVVTPVFEEWKGGQYKIISFHAKRARGLMARYAAMKRIEKVERLQQFDLEGYGFASGASDDTRWVFRRRS